MGEGEEMREKSIYFDSKLLASIKNKLIYS